MGHKRFHGNRFNRKGIRFASKLILIREKRLIESKYGFLKCSIKKNKLICNGKVKPTDYSIEYEIEVVYDGKNSPKVFVKNPSIEYNDDIHMFPSDNSLCLYHSETDNFFWDYKKHHLYDTIVPWALEWFVYYELYLISGKWEHPFIPHNTESSELFDSSISNEKLNQLDTISEQIHFEE